MNETKCIPIEWKCISCGVNGLDYVKEEDKPNRLEKLMLRVQQKHHELNPSCNQSIKESNIRPIL